MKFATLFGLRQPLRACPWHSCCSRPSFAERLETPLRGRQQAGHVWERYITVLDYTYYKKLMSRPKR